MLTPATRWEALITTGWSIRQVAHRLRRDERSVRRWLDGVCEPPPGVDDWLARAAAFVIANPPPKL